jgi:hypothetical protein
MKIKNTKTKVILIFAAAAAALLTEGCAEMGSANTTSLLSAAGFRVRTPQTPQQQQIYAALPPYQIDRATVKGRTFYVYKDEKAGVAYIGREQEYQRYHEWAVQQQIAQNYYMAAETGPCSRIWLVRSLGSASFLVVKRLMLKDVSFDSNSTSCWRQGTHP